jgi:hypothetical protein
VADLVTVWRVDPDRGARAPLGSAPGISLAGLDGMYVIGEWLVGVQNLVGPGRVCAYALAAGHGRIVERRVLAAALPGFAAPTTGAFDGRGFYVVANSQNGTPPAPTVIVQVTLPP